MGFKSIKEMLALEKETGTPLWELILESELIESNSTREQSMERMGKLWDAMKAASSSYEEGLHSASGLSGGDGALMRESVRKNNTVCGDFIGQVMVRALQMAESNACMKRIVAAPTAGSCGVLPAVLLSYQQQFGVPDNEIIKALFIAAGIGEVIARRAFISGAAGGCQAEIGSASCMAAAAVAFLHGGSSGQSAHAGAIALKSLLGLTCDPVAGLVEVPCVKRNVIGAVNALTAADLALAGVKSAIPPDEVIDAMRQVGMSMPESLRETGTGGLAATPTGLKISKRIHRSPIVKE